MYVGTVNVVGRLLCFIGLSCRQVRSDLVLMLFDTFHIGWVLLIATHYCSGPMLPLHYGLSLS